MTQNKNKVCVLISGPDSYAMLYELSKKFNYLYPLYIKFGMRWEKAELCWIRKFLNKLKNKKIKKLKIINFGLKGLLGHHWSYSGKKFPKTYEHGIGSNYIPGRNIILLSIASIYASENNIGNIALGVISEVMHPDSTKKFFLIMEKTINIGLKNKEIRIITSFLGRRKEDIIKRHKDIPFELGLSCINPEGIYHCGYCHKCRERKIYFKKAQVVDKTIYKNSISKTK